MDFKNDPSQRHFEIARKAAHNQLEPLFGAQVCWLQRTQWRRCSRLAKARVDSALREIQMLEVARPVKREGPYQGETNQ